MRRRWTIAALALPLAGCGLLQGEGRQVAGTGTARDYAVRGFTGVDLRGPDDVEVRIGQGFAVRAEGDAKALEALEIAVVGDTLRIGRRRGGGTWLWSGGDRGVRVTVTMPRVAAASVSGSGDLSVQRAEGDFAGSVAGSGDLAVADLRAGKAELSIVGSGDLLVAGTAGGASLSVMGSGDIEAPDFTADSASVSVAGSGSVRARVRGGASVSVVGSGDVELSGGARCAISKTGSGEVRCS